MSVHFYLTKVGFIPAKNHTNKDPCASHLEALCLSSLHTLGSRGYLLTITTLIGYHTPYVRRTDYQLGLRLAIQLESYLVVLVLAVMQYLVQAARLQ